MFERFSSGYYLGRFYVEPYEGTTAAIHSSEHERLNEHLYATGEGIDRLDTPLVMKLERAHFPVLGNEGVPTGTLAVPYELAEECSLPDDRPVLLADAPRARELLRYAGYETPDAT
ncbi:DUF5802 family protein [Haloferax namakaokahaiae]|uniref:DUF5802 family protein n=1 Tax=Haloferax namakaokahaiae TaxID=1748331 RepID=A0ABD5ZAL3_9EURY